MSSKAAVDTGRCVVHIDVDAFYAQCEEIRNPSLKERPLGVTQKYLLVTSNYPARKRGVTKLMGITEAQQKCPDLVLVSGEDLTPYRQASKRILAVLQRFGVCERGGMDEMLVDVTAEAQRRLLQGSVSSKWAAHVHSNKVGLVADNKHRPMDLRVLALRGAITAVTAAGPALPAEVWQPSGQAWEPLLMTGCVIAQEMRAVLKAEAGFRCSAGISSNRMLAKLVSGLHKPDDQTVLLPPDAADFVAPLPVRALPGVGYKMGNELDHMGIKNAADLRQVSQETLTQKFGERIGTFLQLACRGQDPTPVQDKGPPKSITVEDSFKDCSSLQAAEHVIRVLAPDLLARMVEDFQETGRRASTLTLKWRHRGSGWGRSSSSCPMPSPLLNPQADNASQASLLGTTLMALLKKHISEPFQLTLLNIGVSNFTGVKGAAAGGKGGWDPAFAKLMGPSAKRQKLDTSQPAALPLNGAMNSRSAALKSINQRRDYGAQPTAACISKSIERALREEGRVQQPPRTAPGNELDALDWTEQEDWACEMPEEEDAWRPQLVASKHGLYAQPQYQAITAAVIHKQAQSQSQSQQQNPQQQQQQHPSGAAQQAGIRGQNQACLSAASSMQSCPLQSDSVQQHAHALSGTGFQQPGPNIDSSAQQPNASQSAVLLQTNVAGQQSAAASAGSGKASAAYIDIDAAKMSANASEQVAIELHRASSNALPESNNAACVVQLGKESQETHQRQALQAAADINVNICTVPGTSTEASHDQMVEDANREQSDYELALKLQEQEQALLRQHSRPIGNGRVGVRQKPERASDSGTLHAFFKKA